MAAGKFTRWLTPDGLMLLEGWTRDGYTDEDVAKKIGIATSTLYDWKARFPEVSEALKRGKEVVDYQVENALLKRALGYDYEEVQTTVEEKNGRLTKKQVKTKKHVPPETVAALAWLNNRRSEKWRRNAAKEKLDEKKFEHDVDVDGKKYW